MLSREEIQSKLPEGLILEQGRSVHHCQGQLFDVLDHRLIKNQFHIRRIIRILKCDTAAQWRDPWLGSLKNLSEQKLTGVCRPLEIGWIDSVHCYLLFDWFPAVLADQIPAAGLKKSDVAWLVFEKLVCALAELHRSIGPHGDLRSENIFLDTQQLEKDTRPWIGHSDLSGLPEWTKSELLCPESRKIFPPDWSGQLKEPSKSADVYALGLLAIELLLGRRAIENFRNNNIISRAQQRQIGWLKYRWLIKPMLGADCKQRFNDAEGVKHQMHLIQGIRRSLQVTGIVLFAVALMSVFLGWQLKNVRQEVTKLQTELDNKMVQRQTMCAAFDRLN